MPTSLPNFSHSLPNILSSFTCFFFSFPLITDGVKFVLPIYSPYGAIHVSLVDLPGTTSLKETDFSSLRSHQLSIGPWQGVGLLNSPSPCWNAYRFELVQVLYRDYAGTIATLGLRGQDIVSRRHWKTNATCSHPCVDTSIDFHHFYIAYSMKIGLSIGVAWIQMINSVNHPH